MRKLSVPGGQAGQQADEAVVEIGDAGPAAGDLEVLHRVSEALVGQLDLGEVASAVLRELPGVLEASSLAFVVRAGGDRLNVILRTPEGEAVTAAEDDARLARHVIVESRSRTSDEPGAAPRDEGAPRADAGAPPHWLATPMVIGSDAVGAIVLRRAVRPFTEADDRLLGRIARLAALAVRAARRHGDVERRQRRLAALLDVTQRLTRGLDLAALLGTIAGAAAEVFDGEAGFRLVEGGELVRVGATPGALAIMPTERLRLGESLSGRVAASGEAIVTADVWNDPRLMEAHRGIGRRLDALMCLPVSTGAEILGTLNIYGEAGHVFGDEDVALGTRFAYQAAIAIENARLYTRTEARRREAEAVAEVGHVLAETLDPDVVGQRVVESVASLLGARSAALYSFRAESASMAAIATYGVGPADVPPRFVFAAGMGVVGRVVADGRTFTTTNLLEDSRVTHPPDSRARIEALTYRAALGVPLEVKGRVIGALFVGDVEGRAFTEEDARLAETFADQAALVLEGARLHRETERALAEVRSKNAELDTFVYSVSHDLKSPIVSAQGMAGALMEDFGDTLAPEARHYVSRLMASVQHMERLIQDLLSLTRIGRESRPPKDVPLGEVVEEAIAELAEPIRARGIRVTVGVLPTVWGVRTHLEQVMGNLIGNAVKYLGDTTEPAIEVGVEGHDGVEECFVRDNGIGIDPRYHDKVFEIFQRLGDVKTEGTGVGLAIVRKAANRMGGEVGMTSDGASGSIFWVQLPAAINSVQPD